MQRPRRTDPSTYTYGMLRKPEAGFSGLSLSPPMSCSIPLQMACQGQGSQELHLQNAAELPHRDTPGRSRQCYHVPTEEPCPRLAIHLCTMLLVPALIPCRFHKFRRGMPASRALSGRPTQGRHGITECPVRGLAFLNGPVVLAENFQALEGLAHERYPSPTCVYLYQYLKQSQRPLFLRRLLYS